MLQLLYIIMNKHAIAISVVVGRRIGVCHRRPRCYSIALASLRGPLYIKTFHFVIINKAIVEKSVCILCVFKLKSGKGKWNILCLLERTIYIHRWWEVWRRRFFQMTGIWKVARSPIRVSIEIMFSPPPSLTLYSIVYYINILYNIIILNYKVLVSVVE